MDTQKILLQIKDYWKINWIRRSLISLVILFFTLIALPFIFQFSIIYLIEKQGASHASIEDINFNPFAGTFELKQLKVKTADNEAALLDHLWTDISMLDLFSSRIVLNKVTLSGLDAKVFRSENNEILINGLNLAQDKKLEKKPVAQDETTSDPLAFGINLLSVKDIHVEYGETDFTQNLTVKSLQLSSLQSWLPDTSAKLEVSAFIDKAPVTVNASLKLFDQTPSIQGEAGIKSLTFAPYEKFYRSHLSSLTGQLSLQSNFSVKLGEIISAETDNSVEVVQLKTDYQHIHQSLEKLTWQGSTSFSTSSGVSLAGDLSLLNSKTSDSSQKYDISKIASVNLKKLKLNPEQVLFNTLDVENIQIVSQPENKDFVALKSLKFEEMKFQIQESNLQLASVGIASPDIQLVIDEEKQITQLLPLMQTIEKLALDKSSTDAKQESEPANTPFSFQADKVVLTKHGMLKVADNSVSPNYKTIIHFDQIDINNLSSKEDADFKIKLKQGDYTLFDINGKGQLLDPTQKIELTAAVKQLDLPPVTPYTSNVMGYGMKSGVVDSDIELKINNREIESNIKLNIDAIEVVETNTKTAEQISSASGMTIDLAVSTLKDKNDHIELELPVKGNLDKPDFDLSLIINKAMGEAMKSASLAYLKHSLQPFGSLLTLVKLVKAAANHISLPPLIFKTNSLALEKDQQDLLDKVVKVMNERPGLKIKACGVSSQQDQAAIKTVLLKAEEEKRAKEKAEAKKKKGEAEPAEIVIPEELIQQHMRDLADNRAAKIKAYFNKEGKIESKRILNCLSSTDLKEESKPSVDLQI